jgi:hypothetical protein
VGGNKKNGVKLTKRILIHFRFCFLPSDFKYNKFFDLIQNYLSTIFFSRGLSFQRIPGGYF